MRYFDYALNHVNAAQAEAIAKARRDVLSTGDSFRVEANWPGKEPFFWDGCRYDALVLARELVFNRAENVKLTDPSGRLVDVASERY